MAKIFSTITRNTSTLPQQLISASLNAVYDNSQVNTSAPINTFIRLRASTLSPGQIQPVQVYKRIEQIYRMFNSSPVTQSVQFNNDSTSLLTPSSYRRARTTGLYYGFRSYEPTIPVLPASNFTLLEIKPTANINALSFGSLTQISGSFIGPQPTDLMLQDSRSFPAISADRDIYRIDRFLSSADGRSFVGLQAILQGGNTFGQTRLYDISSVKGQTLNYRLASLVNPLSRTSRISYNRFTNEEQLWGRVQKETVINVQTRVTNKFVNGKIKLDRSNALTNYAMTELGRLFIDMAARTRVPRFLGRIAGLPADASFEQFFNQWNSAQLGIQAIIRSLADTDPTLVENQTVYDGLYVANVWPVMQEYQSGDRVRNFHAEKSAYLERAKKSIAQLKGIQINNLNKSTEAYNIPDPLNDYRSSVDFMDIVRTAVPEVEFNGVLTSRYIKDVTNLSSRFQSITDARDLETTDPSARSDFILLRFVVPSVFDRGIDFRAFIEDLTHNAKGQFDDVKYVGRPERFVTYKGMSRSMTLSMFLVAFSEDETETIWTRANMLNKLVYPLNSRGGFMTPPLIRLTVGNVIVDQPGYVESIDMRFQSGQGLLPWDIDKELPMVIKLNMTYNIIEKDYINQAGTNPDEYIQLFNQATSAIRSTSATAAAGTAAPNAPGIPGASEPRIDYSGVGTGIFRDDLLRSGLTQPGQNTDFNRQDGYELSEQQQIDNLRSARYNVTQQEICTFLGYLVDESFQYLGPC